MKINSDRVLIVDDDSNVLSSYKRALRHRFRIDTAYGGESGLTMLSERGPYSVVVADRYMPRMDGIDFLKLAKEKAPNTVRIMLTGNADLSVAIRAINETNVFRFLTKPCDLEVFARSIEEARAHFFSTVEEKELLCLTLRRSVGELSEILCSLEAKA